MDRRTDGETDTMVDDNTRRCRWRPRVKNVEGTFEKLVIWHNMILICRHCKEIWYGEPFSHMYGYIAIKQHVHQKPDAQCMCQHLTFYLIACHVITSHMKFMRISWSFRWEFSWIRSIILHVNSIWTPLACLTHRLWRFRKCTAKLRHLYFLNHRKTSNIRRTLVGNKIVDHSDVVGASPVGAAPTTSSFSTLHLASRDSAKTAARHYENLLSVGIWCVLY